MLEASIPKDIRKYDAKFVGPFTLRQLICVVIASLLCYVVFNVSKILIGQDTATFLCFIFAAPFILVGWLKPFGMPLEKFVQTAFISNFLSPKHRIYKIENPYRIAGVSFNQMNSKDIKKKTIQEKKLAKNNESYIAYN